MDKSKCNERLKIILMLETPINYVISSTMSENNLASGYILKCKLNIY